MSGCGGEHRDRVAVLHEDEDYDRIAAARVMADQDPHIERHPACYPWHERFPSARQVAGFEGGAVYEAEGEGAWWLIKDEGAMADFLDPDRDAELLSSLVSLERYADRDALAAAVERMRDARRRVSADG
jgi:hypothetical protein